MKIKDRVSKIVPYIIILIMSFLACYLVFYKGISKGDDYNFHFANIIDLYKTLKNGYKVSMINGYLSSGFGIGVRNYYSPISHLSVAILARINDLFNFDMIVAYKEIIVLSVFISGIFMYRFSLHFTNKNIIISLISSCVYVLYPYRLFDLFCRMALAEALSFMFIPLFFMGLYDISHDKNINVISFVEIIIGGSLLYLTHNLTAFYTYIAGVIYLLFNIKGIITNYKNDKKYALYCLVSCFLLFSIASLYLFPQLELIKSNMYNITNKVRMWTDVSSVTSRTGEQASYSGFLNIPYLTYKFENFTSSNLTFGLLFYILGTILFIIFDNILKEIKLFKKIHTLIPSIILFILISLTSRRLEIYLGAIIFIILYNIVIYNLNSLNSNNNKFELFKDVNFWFCIVMSIISLVFMDNETVWEHLPSIFLNIQFPWRLWTFVQFYVSYLIGLIIYKINYKKTLSIVACILIGFLMCVNEPLVEKRMRFETNDTTYIIENTDEDLLNISSSIGWNKEYCPQVFTDNSYKSIYSNSLYKKIKYGIINGYSSIEDYSIDPVCLEGNATIEVINAFASNFEMNIEVNSDTTLIQMPLIYYEGYEFTITNIDTNQSFKINPFNIDGLLAFNLDKGNYKITTKYKGTKLANLGKVLCITGSISTLFLLIYPYFKRKKTIIKQK